MNSNVQTIIDAKLQTVSQRQLPIVHSSIGELARFGIHADVVLEIGAYDGCDIFEIHRLWPTARIDAFECDMENFQRLQDFDCECIHCNQLAVSNKTGKQLFYRTFENKDQKERSDWHKTAGSLLRNASLHRSVQQIYEQPVEVNTTTLNDYCRLHKIRPDVLLIDTQGSEYEILEGASDILPTTKAILTEWSSKELYENQKFIGNITELLTRFGFTLVRRIDLWEHFHGDAIFISKRGMKDLDLLMKVKLALQRIGVG